MKKVPKIPQIRVKGFTQEWTEHLLNYYLETSQEKNFDGLYQKEDVLSVSGDCGIVNQIEFQGRSFAGASVLNYGVVHTGDVVYTKSPLKENPYGIIKTSTGKAGIVSTLYAVYHPKEVTYSEFVQWYFENNDRLNHYLNPLVNKGAKNDMKVSSDNALLGTVIFPDSAEQKAISDFLTHIKNIILQCESRLEKLQSLKASMLEKMFPKDGANVPEVRFKGFIEVWEQHKLGEIGRARSGVGFPDSEQGGTSGTPFFKVSDMNLAGNEHEMTVANNYVTEEQITSHRWSPIEDLPAIFFAKVGAAVMLNRKRLCRISFLLDNNTMAYSFDEKMLDSNFAKALFETVDLTSLIQVGALPSYNTGDVELMKVYLPSVPEQKKIGEYFEQLDDLIVLQQQALDKLQSIKKALLEKMFV